MRKIDTKRQTEMGKKKALKALKRKKKIKELKLRREQMKVFLKRRREKEFNEYMEKLLASRQSL